MALLKLTLIATVIASINGQFFNQSAPFNLVLCSTNSTYDNSILSVCHEGAAIESLCVDNVSHIGQINTDHNSQYQLNYSSDSDTGYGFLTWLLPYTGENGPANESEAMIMNYNPSSNIAVPIFSPTSEDAQIISFNGDNNMYIPAMGDDTVVPQNTRARANLTRWYVCETNVGYSYTTLAWLLGGDSEPENPSCVKVDVKRIFV